MARGLALVLVLLATWTASPVHAQREVEVVAVGGASPGTTIEVAALGGPTAEARRLRGEIARGLGLTPDTLTEGERAYRATVVIGRDGAVAALYVFPLTDRERLTGIPAAIYQVVPALRFSAGRQRTLEIILALRAPDAPALADLDDAALAARFPPLSPELLPLWVPSFVARASHPRVQALGDSGGAAGASLRRAATRVLARDTEAVRLCYQQIVSTWGALAAEGSLEVELAIGPDGRVSVVAPRPDDADRADLHRCLRARAATWTFPMFGVQGTRLVVRWMLHRVPAPARHAGGR